MQQKRGQVTIFIIIAILIVAGIFLFFYVKNKTASLTPTIPRDIQPVYDYLNDCFEEKVYSSIYEIGQFGGYKSPPNNSLDIGIPIYLDNRFKEILPLKEIEVQLSEIIEEELNKCQLNFSSIEVNRGDPKIKVSILNNQIRAQIEYPITIIKNDGTYQLKNFPEIIAPIKFGLMYSSGVSIVDLQIANNGSLCLTCLLDLGEENDLSISTFEYEEGINIFSIADNNQINNQTYELVFATK
ncbi:hypothetical protein FJZ17_00540 [Candidatus Pacearchaeota archaeon]|nr:hypothetical protein [Candidatus Pacearchaeota archaeon]